MPKPQFSGPKQFSLRGQTTKRNRVRFTFLLNLESVARKVDLTPLFAVRL